MNDLELEAEDRLYEMVTGESVTLPADAIPVIENWVAKTALVLESRDQGAKAMTPEFAQQLMTSAAGRPTPYSPIGFFTWASAVEPNNDHALRSSVHGLTIPDHKGCKGHFWRIATIQVGTVKFLTAYSGNAVASQLLFERCFSFMPATLISGRLVDWHLDRSSPTPFTETRNDHDALIEHIMNVTSTSD